MAIHPLIFEPILKPRIWGGDRLARLLGKSPSDQPIGESWEVADLEHDQSRVTAGPAKGQSLGELVKRWGADLVGDAPLVDGRFPLLLKYLDAQENLSVQVHPDATMAGQSGGGVRIKHEAWYVIAADKGGCIYRGLKVGVTREDFTAAIQRGDCDQLLNRIPVAPGQCYYLPSGTVHALGAGVLVAEVQTPSDVTFRVFDWNRVDPATGQPRDLHIDKAMACIDFDHQPIRGEERSHVASVWTTVTRLVTCDSFIIERVRMIEGYDGEIPYAQLVVWMVLEGRGVIAYDDNRERLAFGRGDTVVLPGGLADARLTTLSDCTWLEITVPPKQ